MKISRIIFDNLKPKKWVWFLPLPAPWLCVFDLLILRARVCKLWFLHVTRHTLFVTWPVSWHVFVLCNRVCNPRQPSRRVTTRSYSGWSGPWTRKIKNTIRWEGLVGDRRSGRCGGQIVECQDSGIGGWRWVILTEYHSIGGVGQHKTCLLDNSP